MSSRSRDEDICKYWQELLGPKFTLELIEQAHMDAEFFSNKICLCGCGNKLPKTIANRGWEYLYKHKPRPKDRVSPRSVIKQFPTTISHQTVSNHDQSSKQEHGDRFS